MIPFEWHEPEGIADHQQLADWEGLLLWAHPDGTWRVVNGEAEKFGNGRGHRILVSSEEQVPGKDINEARQRAQAAAIVQHSLRQNINHHGNSEARGAAAPQGQAQQQRNRHR